MILPCYFVLFATCLTLGQAKSCNYYDGPKANASLDAGTVSHCNNPREATQGNYRCFLIEYYHYYDPNTPQIERGCVSESIIDTFCSSAIQNGPIEKHNVTDCRICESDCDTSGSTTAAVFYQAIFIGFALIILKCNNS